MGWEAKVGQQAKAHNSELVAAVGAVILGILPAVVPMSPLVRAAFWAAVDILLLFVIWRWKNWRWTRTRRALASILTTATVVAIAWILWPATRNDVLNELNELADKGSWSSLAGRIEEIAEDPTYKDIELYFRGVLAFNSQGSRDAERFLSLVPPDSDLYIAAQGLRYENWARNGANDSEAAALADSMNATRPTLYYRLRLGQPLTYKAIAALYDDFKRRFAGYFDFVQMKERYQFDPGRPVLLYAAEMRRVPGAVLLLLVSQIKAAHNECLADEKRAAANRYEALVRNHARNLHSSLRDFALDPSVTLQEAAQVKERALPAACGGTRFN